MRGREAQDESPVEGPEKSLILKEMSSPKSNIPPAALDYALFLCQGRSAPASDQEEDAVSRRSLIVVIDEAGTVICLEEEEEQEK